MQNKRILYDNGKIKEVKSMYNLNGLEIKFTKEMVNTDKNFSLTELIWQNRNLRLGNFTLHQLYNELLYRDFILFVDHDSRRIELMLDDGTVHEIEYSNLEIVRKFFSKCGGIKLESADFKDLELFSYDDVKAIKEAIKRLDRKSIGRTVIEKLSTIKNALKHFFSRKLRLAKN